MNIALILLVVALIVFLVVLPFIKRVVSNMMMGFLYRRDFQSFDKMIDSLISRMCLDPFNVDYLKMNRALLEDDEKAIDESFDRFDIVKLNDSQKKSVYLSAFQHYISVGNGPKANKYYKLLHEMGDGDLNRDIDRYYDTYFKKGYRYLDDMLADLDKTPEDSLPMAYDMIATMYRNKGDEEKASEYDEKAYDLLHEAEEKIQ